VHISRVQVRVVKYDAKTGRAVGQSSPLLIDSIAPSKRGQIAVGEHIKSPKELQLYKVIIEAAELNR